MSLIAIGAVRLKHWIWTREFFWRSHLALRQARANGDCLHAEVFSMQGYYISMTRWRNGASMKRYAQSNHHARVMKAATRIAVPLHFRHVQMDRVPDHAEAFDLWHSGICVDDLSLVNRRHTP